MLKEAAKELVKKKVQFAGAMVFLKYILPILLGISFLFALLLIMNLLFGSGNDQKGGLKDGKGINLSEEVLQHKPTVIKYAKEFNVQDYVGIILALMMQESGGEGLDPMQASESLCGSVGCIHDTETSIEQGVKYFSMVIERAESDVKLALQSYNFGLGFIPYVMDNGGEYTQDLAIDFSVMKYEQLKHTGNFSCIHPSLIDIGACYGDVYYVENVLQYYNKMNIPIDGDIITPVAGMNPTSNYGWRTHPISGEKSFHTGIDFSCVGNVTPIYAVKSGTIKYAEFHVRKDGTDGYGNYVMIKHGDGLITAYAHMSEIMVNQGGTVKQGQQIGICGSTGNSTGPHLHFEAKTKLWDGHMNPSTLFKGG